MSINNNRMKWWEKYSIKDVQQRIDTNTADLRDLLRAILLRMLHAKIDLLDIEKVIDNIIQKIQANYSAEDIINYVLSYTPELNEHEEDIDD